MNEVVGAVTVTRLGSSSPDAATAADDDWFERVSAAAAVGTSRSSIVDRDDDGGGPLPARLVVLVPFREDEDGTRGPQLTRLLRRLRDVFRGVAPVAVCVAEQSSDGRRFNRGHALNAAFLHLRRNRPGWWDARTLWCFHDCDMLPDPSLAAHYLRLDDDDAYGRNGQNDDDESPRERNDRRRRRGGFVRVLEAGGCRYDADGCFGGVTVYDERGFIATNGYPNGFWGWGGEDNAQFLRCVAARLRLERVSRCDFEDLERGTETVDAKLAALDERRARCPAKEKRRLLRRNAAGDGWRRDGLVDSRYEIIEERALRIRDDIYDDATATDDFRGVRVVVKLLAGIEDAAPGEEEANLLRAAVDEAGKQLQAMRAAEGANLEANLREHGRAIRAVLERIEERMPQVVKHHHDSLRERVQELLGDSATLSSTDLARELAMLADRLDVREETDRLDSHLKQLEAQLDKGGAVGRQLDFLAQEFLREANTIGSKCSDAQVAHDVVELKTHIERLREQVQNVE